MTAAAQQQPVTLVPSIDVIENLAAEITRNSGDDIDWAQLERALDASGAGLTEFKHLLECGSAALTRAFLREKKTTTELVQARAELVDLIILAAWRKIADDIAPNAAIVAVGGYGRKELHPHSDVDLLVLIGPRLRKKCANPVAKFLAFLWDVGLEVGHSTRTVKECAEQSRDDLTIVTTLMEARLLAGPDKLFDEMKLAIATPKVWPSKQFFTEKFKEQNNRHARYGGTGYNLEPNVKGSPGGLRDIQNINWVTRRHFGTDKLEGLVDEGFLTAGQLRILKQGREFLWRIRFGLHILTGRREDRLLFDHQTRLASLLGYKDASYMLAVEQMMQRYYRTVMELSRLNEMMLQLFQEAILMNPDVEPEPLDEHFEVRNGFLQIVDAEVFERHPAALLELFLKLQQHPELKGVSARTLTELRRHLHLIDDEFRQNPRHQQLFLEILRAPAGVTHELRRMNLYGVLGLYIPAFGRIVGRMQYDLFHAYTVDEHTLFVVSNLRRFALERFDHEFPHCSEIMQGLPIPEVAYLGGLFHDIAKGRGGDHSELGAVDAESFCLEHGLSRYEARLVAWLVRHHLALSVTAQKRDIGDPEVIREFAELVGDETHLDYLYLLTVADVRATNPNLWNSWRAQLFEELYRAAQQALRRGLENPIDKDELLAERRTSAREKLLLQGLTDARVDELWNNFGEEYFLRFKTEEIAAHTLALDRSGPADSSVRVTLLDDPATSGTQVILFAPQRIYTFAIATAVFDELGLNVHDARLVPLANDIELSTFVILEEGGESVDESRRGQIRRRLDNAFAGQRAETPTVTRRAPRQVRMFSTPTRVRFDTDDRNRRTVMEIRASDRPGLLCEIGMVLRDRKIRIHTAKIVTVGERAEDVFYITDDAGEPLRSAACEQLATLLTTTLDNSE